MNKIAIVGGGNVGTAMALDLAKKHSITIFDIVDKGYPENIAFRKINLLETDPVEVLANYDLVITAVPGHTGFAILERVISAGKNVVDISFFP